MGSGINKTIMESGWEQLNPPPANNISHAVIDDMGKIIESSTQYSYKIRRATILLLPVSSPFDIFNKTINSKML